MKSSVPVSLRDASLFIQSRKDARTKRFGFLIKIFGIPSDQKADLWVNVEKWRKDFKNNEGDALAFEIQFPFPGKFEYLM